MESGGSQSWQTFKFGTWNVRSLGKKKMDVVGEIEREKEDVVVLTETKLRGSGREDIGDYVHLFSGVPYQGGRLHGGVSVLIKKDLSRNLSWGSANERIIWVKLNICGHEVVVIGVYWVDNCRSPDVKVVFQSKLRRVLRDVEDNQEIIVLGDFNAWVGKAVDNKVVGKFGLEEVNDNGKRLKCICKKFRLKIQNTFFKHRDVHKYTWYGRAAQKTLVDYCITRQDSKLEVRDVIACRWLECGTDHIFLEATISCPVIQGNIPRLLERETPETVKYRTFLLFSNAYRDAYRKELDSIIHLSVKRTTDEMYQHLKKSIHSSARHVLGCVNQDGFEEFLWDNEIKELRRSTADQGTQEHLRNETNDKNEVWKGICAYINDRDKNKKRIAARSILNELLNRKCDDAIRVNKKTSQSFFRKRIEFDKSSNPVAVKLEDSSINQLLPVDIIDVNKAVEDLEDCNYPVPGGLTARLLNLSSTKTKTLLRDLIQRIFDGGNIPAEINEIYIYAVSNVKEQSEAKRTIQVMHPIMTVMGSLLNVILENKDSFKKASILHEQQINVTFVLRLILQKSAAKQERLVHFAVIDLVESYACVSLKKLFERLRRVNVGENLILILKRITEGNSAGVMRGCEQGLINIGLQYGFSLASTLFKIYLEEPMKAWREDISCGGKTLALKIGSRYLSYLFSDDKLTIFAGSKRKLESMMDMLKVRFEEMGLEIKPENVSYLGEKDLKMGDKKLAGSKTIEYLGSILELSGGNEAEINKRVLEANEVIGLLHTVARDETITAKNKRRIFKSVVRSFLTFGCETWALMELSKKRINGVEMRYWKCCCDTFPVKWTNRRIYEFMGVKQKVCEAIILKKAAWYAEMQGMNKDQWARCVLEWEPEGKMKPGNRKTWMDGVKCFLKVVSQNPEQLELRD